MTVPNSEDELAGADAGVWRVDLHCHSRYSSPSGRWLAREAGLRGSHTGPEAVYGLAKARGMTHVTLTDHDSIEGALRLAHREDFFIGEEVTAFFPGEAVEVHVLVWGIDEAQHAEIRERRFDVRELVEYLRARGVAHALAHPFALATGGLRVDQLETLLTLFDIWEVRNGLSCRAEGELVEDLVARSSALRTRRGPGDATTAVRAIGVMAGSDDRTGLDVGRTYTAVPRGDSGLLEAVMQGLGRPYGPCGSTAKLAHNAIALVADLGIGEGPGRRVVDRAADLPLTWRVLGRPGGRRLVGQTVSLVTAAERLWRGPSPSPTGAAVRDLMKDHLSVEALTMGVRHEEIQTEVGRAWQAATREALGVSRGFDIGAALRDRKRVRALLDAQGLLAPYLMAAGFHARQRRHVADAAARLAERGLAARPGHGFMPRVAMFTDTFEEINGVGTVLRELVRYANDHDWPFTLVSAGPERRSEPGHEVFPAADSRTLDVYPGFPMSLLPIIDVLRWCEETEIEVIHAATPGPVGVGAWLLATSLDLPLVGTYHTDLPRLGFFLTGDHLVTEGLWAYVRLFYDQCSVVFCPSEVTRRDLIEHRLRSTLLPFHQGVDCEHFSPDRRDEAVRAVLGGGKSLLLWVGRVSPEKGLDALAAAYAALLAKRDDVHLVVVGEGPGGDRLRGLAPDATYLGVKTGIELATVYASADVFLFPGTADTFGQTVLEAAASGLPAVVVAGSGTQDALIPGVTALTVAPGDRHGFVAAVERLLDDPALRARMRTDARAHALTRTWPATFAQLADTYRTLDA